MNRTVGVRLAIVVTVALLAADLVLIMLTAHRLPYSDDWSFVPWTSGQRALSGDWLWAAHNEHRVPLMKAVHVVTLRSFDMDYRAPVVANVLLLATSALILIAAIARVRVLKPVDLGIPLLVLNPGHGVASWSFYTQFAGSVAGLLLVAAWALTASQTGRRPRGLLVALLAGLLLLAVSGATGAAALVGVAAWTLIAGTRRVVERGTAIAIGALAALLIVPHLIGATSTSDAASPATTAGFGVRLLATAAGPQLDRTWPLNLVLTAAVLALVGADLRRGPLRWPMLMLVLGTATTAMAVTLGRAHRPWGGLAGHYAILLIPVALAGVLAVGTRPGWAKAAALATCVGVFTLGAGAAGTRRDIVARENAFLTQAASASTLEELARTHVDTLFFEDSPATRRAIAENLCAYFDTRRRTVPACGTG